jgi:hypothetical protein
MGDVLTSLHEGSSIKKTLARACEFGISAGMPPRFAVGASVIYSPDITQDRRSGGLFVVMRLLPVESGAYSYRIQDAAGRERVAPEYQLESAA